MYNKYSKQKSLFNVYESETRKITNDKKYNSICNIKTIYDYKLLKGII